MPRASIGGGAPSPKKPKRTKPVNKPKMTPREALYYGQPKKKRKQASTKIGKRMDRVRLNPTKLAMRTYRQTKRDYYQTKRTANVEALKLALKQSDGGKSTELDNVTNPKMRRIVGDGIETPALRAALDRKPSEATTGKPNRTVKAYMRQSRMNTDVKGAIDKLKRETPDTPPSKSDVRKETMDRQKLRRKRVVRNQTKAEDIFRAKAAGVGVEKLRSAERQQRKDKAQLKKHRRDRKTWMEKVSSDKENRAAYQAYVAKARKDRQALLEWNAKHPNSAPTRPDKILSFSEWWVQKRRRETKPENASDSGAGQSWSGSTIFNPTIARKTKKALKEGGGDALRKDAAIIKKVADTKIPGSKELVKLSQKEPYSKITASLNPVQAALGTKKTQELLGIDDGISVGDAASIAPIVKTGQVGVRGTVAAAKILKGPLKRAGKKLLFTATRNSAKRAASNKALGDTTKYATGRGAQALVREPKPRVFTVDAAGTASEKIPAGTMAKEFGKAFGRTVKGQGYTRGAALAGKVAIPLAAGGVVAENTNYAIISHFTSGKGRTTKTSMQALASSPAALWSMAVDAGTSAQRAAKTGIASLLNIQSDHSIDMSLGPIDLGNWHVVRYTGAAIEAPIRGQVRQQLEYYGPLVDLATASSYETRSGQKLQGLDAWEAALEEKYGYTLVPTAFLAGKGGYQTFSKALGWSARSARFKIKMKTAQVLEDAFNAAASQPGIWDAIAPRPGAGDVAAKAARAKTRAATQTEVPVKNVTDAATEGPGFIKSIRSKRDLKDWADRMRMAAVKEEVGVFLAEGVFSKNKTVALRQLEQRREDLIDQGRYPGEVTVDKYPNNGIRQWIAKHSGRGEIRVPTDIDLVEMLLSNPELLSDAAVRNVRDAFVRDSKFVQNAVTFSSPTRSRAPRGQFYGLPKADELIPMAELRKVDPNSNATLLGGLEDELWGKEVPIGPKVTKTDRKGNYRVVVAGPRDLSSAAARTGYAKRLRSVFESLPPGTIVSTAAHEGVDAIAQSVARQLGIPFEELPKNWAKKNAKRTDAAHGLIAVKTQKEFSPGTDEMVKRAKENNIPVTIVSKDGVKGAKKLKVVGDKQLLDMAVEQYRKYRNHKSGEFANPEFAKQQLDRAKAEIERLQPLVTEKRLLAQGRLDPESYDLARMAGLEAYRANKNPNATLADMMRDPEGRKGMREQIFRAKSAKARDLREAQTLPEFMANDRQLARDKALIEDPAYVAHDPVLKVNELSTPYERSGLPKDPSKRWEGSAFAKGDINRSFPHIVNRSIVRPLFIEAQYEFARSFLATNALRPEEEFPTLGIRAVGKEAGEMPIYLGDDLHAAMNKSKDFRAYMRRNVAIPLSDFNKALKDPDSMSLAFNQYVESVDAAANALKKGQIKFSPGNRYVIVPAVKGREFIGQLQSGGGFLEGFRTFTRAQSKLVLGLSPAWAALQIPAEIAQASIAGGYRFVTPLRDDWKNVSPEDQALWYAYSGSGPGPGTVPSQLASRENSSLLKERTAAEFDPNRFAVAMSILERTPLGRALRHTTHVEWLGMLDAWKGKKIRGRLMRVQLDREINGMLGNAPEVFGLTQKLTQELRDAAKGPGGSKKQQLELLLRDPRYMGALEELASYVDDMLGNWVAFTRREKIPASVVFFYPFIRMSLKWLFYSLPKHHPARAALLYQLGGANASALKDMLTSSDGQTQDPQFLNLLMQAPLHGLSLDENGMPLEGNVKFMNVARISPTTSAPYEFLTNPDRPLVLLNMLPPLISNPVGAILGVDSLTGRVIVPENATVTRTGDIVQPSSRGKGANASSVTVSGLTWQQKAGFATTRIAGLPFPVRALLSGKEVSPGDWPWTAHKKQMKGLIAKLLPDPGKQQMSTWGIPMIENAGLVRDRSEFFQLVREMQDYSGRIDDILADQYQTRDDKRRKQYDAQMASLQMKIDFRQKKIDAMSRKYGVPVIKDRSAPRWRRDTADLGSRIEKSPWFIGDSSTGKNRPLADKPWRKTTP
jgi:hypothetical protein